MGEGAMPVYEVGREGGMFGSDSFMWIIFLFFLIGWGGNGFGGNGALGTYATQQDIQRGFDTNTIINKLDGITNGLSDGFYAQNTTMLQGFNGVGSAIANLGYQMQSCCCETNRNIDAVRYEAAKNACDIVNAIHAEGEATRGLITQNTIQDLRDQLDQARGIISNTNQSRYLLDSLGRYVTNPPCPSTLSYGCGCTGTLY